MIAKIKELLKSLFSNEQGKPAGGSILAALSFTLFTFVTLYLLLQNLEWKHYDTFTAATMGTSAGGIIPNIVKAITERGKASV